MLTVLLAVVVAIGATWTNAFGVRERIEHLVARVDLALHPPVDRDSAPTVQITPPPDEVAGRCRPERGRRPVRRDRADPGAGPDPDAATQRPTDRCIDDRSDAPTDPTDPAPTGTPRPTPKPVRKPVSLSLKVADPDTTFVSQVDNTMCAPAGLQMVLAMHGHADTSDSFQRKLHGRLDEWETRKDAKAGGWGPAAMVEALAAYGVKGYEVRAYENRNQALRDAAIAMTRTGAPAILIAWRGAHTWVMTGYKADGDPTVFGNARITGIRIFDPWYPRVSSIWGASDPPGTLQDLSEIKRNFLQWQRPEGSYPDRDGKYLVVIPTIPLRDQLGTPSRWPLSDRRRRLRSARSAVGPTG